MLRVHERIAGALVAGWSNGHSMATRAHSESGASRSRYKREEAIVEGVLFLRTNFVVRTNFRTHDQATQIGSEAI